MIASGCVALFATPPMNRSGCDTMPSRTTLWQKARHALIRQGGKQRWPQVSSPSPPSASRVRSRSCSSACPPSSRTPCIASPGRTSRASTPKTSSSATCSTCSARCCRCGSSRIARKPGEPKLRVFNPMVEEHGWHSPHTVVQIVNDDMPFLVDSLQMEVQRHGLTLHFIAHPIVTVRRDAQGQRLELVGGARSGRRRARIADAHRGRPDRRRDAAKRIRREPFACVRRRARRRDRLEGDAEEDGARSAPSCSAALRRSGRRWLRSPAHSSTGSPTTISLSSVIASTTWWTRRTAPGSRSSRDRAWACCARRSDETLSPSFMLLPARLREHARERNLLVITKSNWRATVHRPGYLDYIGIKRYDAKGNVSGEHRFLGLYTSTAYSAKPADIPLLRRKVAQVFERAGFPRESHAGKSLANILDTYPRDELFQIDDDDAGQDCARDPQARRPAAVAAVRALRPVRALRLLPDLRPARTLHDRAASPLAEDPRRGLQRLGL